MPLDCRKIYQTVQALAVPQRFFNLLGERKPLVIRLRKSGVMWLDRLHIQLPVALEITIVKTGTINHPTLSHLLRIDLIEKVP